MPDQLFLGTLEDKKVIYNREYAKDVNFTGFLHATFFLTPLNTTIEKIYCYQFRITINDTNESTISDVKDSPIHIDEPWVLFYLKNNKTLKYEMTRPSEEDI